MQTDQHSFYHILCIQIKLLKFMQPITPNVGMQDIEYNLVSMVHIHISSLDLAFYRSTFAQL